ncbi:glutathione S-transferase T3-like [Eutrema salsugineum]|uniref:glutathione S-transferase T3-like n=1 Tax=Eutrema salsugineum TaxID=72664 RepID=UPI000CED1C12|nr:glutathione S-transferase T3-like [Eutrema salsugineum]
MPSFVNLLTSQLNPHTIELGSSELPRFSSQCSDDPGPPTEDLKERRKWSPKEDLVLISVWLNTSKDAVVGNEQKAGAFWKRIQTYYNNSHQLLGEKPREWKPLKQWWSRINELVCKFVDRLSTEVPFFQQ